MAMNPQYPNNYGEKIGKITPKSTVRRETPEEVLRELKKIFSTLGIAERATGSVKDELVYDEKQNPRGHATFYFPKEGDRMPIRFEDPEYQDLANFYLGQMSGKTSTEVKALLHS